MEFEKIEKVALDIKELKIQGAINIALAAEEALEDFIEYSVANTREEFLQDLKKAGKILKNSRPSAVALPNAVDLFISEVEKLPGELFEIKKEALAIGKNIIEKTKNAAEQISAIGSKLIKDHQVVFTHCHSSTVIGILKKAREAGKRFEVVCTETRPWRQGFITARELAETGIPVTLVVDSAAFQEIEHADIVLVGADTITKEGKVINKIGTAQIALIAKHFKVPFYVAAQKIKFTDKQASQIKLEKRPAEEILEGRELEKVKIKNIVFDVTEPEYIKGIITEDGKLEYHI